MYQEHVPMISTAMRADPRVFARGVLFAVCSIRQPFPSVPDQLQAVDAGDLEPLFGHKLVAHAYVLEHMSTLQKELLEASDNAARLEIICQVPGLGLVKGGFILQLMGYDVACLDARNIKREKRNPRAFRSDGEAKKQGPAWRRKIARYLRETEGKAEYYWDAWCEDVAVTYNLTAEEISAMHTTIVPDDWVPF